MPVNEYLALGTIDKECKYALVSAYGLGSSNKLTERVSKVLAHEMVHATTGMVDCYDEKCIMYSFPFSYKKLPKEVLGILDQKRGWCGLHKAILFPE